MTSNGSLIVLSGTNRPDSNTLRVAQRVFSLLDRRLVLKSRDATDLFVKSRDATDLFEEK